MRLKELFELPLKRLHFGRKRLFTSNALSMPETKLISMNILIKIQCQSSSVLCRIVMMQKETALSVHANSTDVATMGFQLLLLSILLLLASMGVSWTAQPHCPSSLL